MHLLLFILLVSTQAFSANVIEKQLEEIGAVQNEEVVVVQRQFTKKEWRHELTPITLGGVPFGTIRRSLFGSASYTLHANDWLGLEIFNFAYTKNFFTSFATDINANKAGGLNTSQSDIYPDYEKLLYFLTAGIQITPTYGKVATFSRYTGYFEPYFSLGAGIAKTETNNYFTFYPGIGFRVYFKEWFSFKLEFRDYLYTESATARRGAELRNNYSVMASLSFWLPKMPR